MMGLEAADIGRRVVGLEVGLEDEVLAVDGGGGGGGDCRRKGAS